MRENITDSKNYPSEKNVMRVSAADCSEPYMTIDLAIKITGEKNPPTRIKALSHRDVSRLTKKGFVEKLKGVYTDTDGIGRTSIRYVCKKSNERFNDHYFQFLADKELDCHVSNGFVWVHIDELDEDVRLPWFLIDWIETEQMS